MRACKCEERQRPISERDWYVVRRNYNTSAFNGYKRTYSDYSDVWCEKCDAYWRTKADYVPHLCDKRALAKYQETSSEEAEE